jgi:hypothetical protein
MFFLVDDWPEFNARWLLVYPFLALMWLPTYWYLDLIRRSSRIKSLLHQYGNLMEVYRNCVSVREDLKQQDRETVTADIKHPRVDDLTANCLLFPLSIPLFFGENAVRMTIDYMRQWMEEVRKKINSSINNMKV